MSDYEEQEYEVKYARVYPKRCGGCQRHGKAVMVSVSSEQEDNIQDYFFTNEQTKQLFNELGRVLIENKKPFRDNELSSYFKGEPE